jgi:hypothetical protein
MGLRSFSYGGGWQSTAGLVLAATGVIDFPLFIFANVGDDSEHPDTLAYVENYARPYAAKHGIELVTVERVMQRTGEKRTLHQDLTREGSKSVKIPVRMSNGKPGKRACTTTYKIEQIGRELKRRGATAQAPATVGIGISLDEIHRANTRSQQPYERITFPLLDLKIRRVDCIRIIHQAGLPMPPKSACWFCPLRSVEAWHQMRRENPEQFEKACCLEDDLNRRRAALGRDPMWFTRFNMPLRQAIRDHGQDLLPGFDQFDPADGGCDSGHCFT